MKLTRVTQFQRSDPKQKRSDPKRSEALPPNLTIYIYIYIYNISKLRGPSNGLTNHPGGDVYRGLLMHAGLLLLLLLLLFCCRRRLTGGSFWTNRAEAHCRLVFSPVRLPEQLRSSRLVDLAPNFA